MILHLATSGGIGGFGLGGGPARIDVDRLPRELRQQACAAIEDGTFARLAKAPPSPGADRITWEVTVEEKDGTTTRYSLPEAALDPEMLDLLDGLRSEAKAQK